MDSMNIDGTWVYLGSVIEFLYKGVLRKGKVERMGVSSDRHSAQSAFIQLLTDAGSRNFSIDKIEGKVIRHA